MLEREDADAVAAKDVEVDFVAQLRWQAEERRCGAGQAVSDEAEDQLCRYLRHDRKMRVL